MKKLSYLILLFFLWSFPTLIFLVFYKKITEKEHVTAHILLMSDIILALLSIIISSNFFLDKKKNFFLNFSFSIVFFTFTLISYTLMLFGILSWGRIPTYNIMKTYISQLDELIKTLEISYLLIAAILIFYFSFITFLSYVSAQLINKTKPNTNKKLLPISILILSIIYLSNKTLYNIILTTDHNNPWVKLFLYNPLNEKNSNILLSVIGNNNKYSKIKNEEQYSSLYSPSQSSDKKSSIILITIDALRPDRMGVYGAERQTTPFLQQMKDINQAHIVKEARSACSESTCGLLSLLSGKEPHQLLSKNFGLPEILGKIGYKRYYILSGDHSNYYGLRESYGESDYYWDGSYNKEGYVNDDFDLIANIKTLPVASSDQSYFFFIHLMSVHGLGKRHPEFEKWIPNRSIYNLSSDLRNNLDLHRNHYDNGILQADFLLKQIYAILKEKKYIDETSIILVTADHGEALGEHGIRSHAESLYEPVIRIPWIWLGSRSLSDTNDPVIQADFAPTVLEEIGESIPTHWSGLPLQKGTSNRRYTFHAQLPLFGIIYYKNHDREKFVINTNTNEQFYFNLSKDKEEKGNIKQYDSKIKHHLEKIIFDFFSNN